MSVADAVLREGTDLKAKQADHHWLGQGVYFWEYSPERAWRWATETLTRKNSTEAPAVVGAVINPGLCLDLTVQECLDEMALAYGLYREARSRAGLPLQENEGRTADLKLRRLDCAVIQHLHTIRDEQGLPPYDTVRSPFHEDGPLYDGTSFTKSAHVQLCVCNPDAVLGYFRLREPVQVVASAARKARKPVTKRPKA